MLGLNPYLHSFPSQLRKGRDHFPLLQVRTLSKEDCYNRSQALQKLGFDGGISLFADLHISAAHKP
jgi:hypothetical protein